MNYFFLPSFFRIKKSNFIPSVFFKVNTQFYTQFLKEAYLQVDDKNNLKLEHLYFNILINHTPRYFKYLPIIRGQSGSNGTYYNEISSFELLKRKIIFRISSLIQTFLPG